MSDAPVVLGINRTQDASVCLMQGSRLSWASRLPPFLVTKRDAPELPT
ncbi:MAG: hypothetical protein WCC39_04855 [Telluria sp.]